MVYGILLGFTAAVDAETLTSDGSDFYPADTDPMHKDAQWFGPVAANGNDPLQNNQIELTGKVEDQSVLYGGYNFETDNPAVVKNNYVHVSSDGQVSTAVGGSGLLSENNKVVVDGTVTQAVYGGTSILRDSDVGGRVVTADNNTVIINGTVNGGVCGGWATNFSSYSQPGSASGNRVTVTGSVIGAVVGGKAVTKADNNTVIIDNGTVGAVNVGYAGDAFHDPQSISGNSLQLLGMATVQQRAQVTSLYSPNSDFKLDESNRNSVYVEGETNVGSLEGFTDLHVKVTAKNQEQKTAAITVHGVSVTDLLGNPTGETLGISLDDVTVSITGNSALSKDKTIYVIERGEKLQDTIAVNKNTVINYADAFKTVQWTFNGDQELQAVEINGDKLNGSLDATTVEVSDNTKTLAESFLGTIAFVNQGAEFIADEGMAAVAAVAEPGKLATFGAMHGGTSRYETGSHVDVDGASLMAGVASKYSDLTYAGFIEAGWASSDSHVEGTTADGDHDYYGVGAIVRYAATDALHLDASARLGWAKTKFSGSYGETSGSYDSDSFYVTSHVGAGYTVPLSKTISAEAYARYVYSYLKGDDAGINGYTFHMENVDTHAVRIGARLLGECLPNVSWRLGAAYEHVFGGDADSSLTGFGNASLEAPSLSGNTGILEVGTTMKPSAESPWSFDLGVKGYVGDRRGVTGNATVLYRF